MYTTFSHVSATRPYHTLLSFSWTGRDGEYRHVPIYLSRQSSLPLVLPSTRDENANGNGKSTGRIWRGSPLGLFDI